MIGGPTGVAATGDRAGDIDIVFHGEGEAVEGAGTGSREIEALDEGRATGWGAHGD